MDARSCAELQRLERLSNDSLELINGLVFVERRTNQRNANERWCYVGAQVLVPVTRRRVGYTRTMNIGVLLEALEFASIKHRDQRRKDRERSPYINHPIAVARTLWTAGVHDETTIAAAILHDTVEDTETTRHELASRFGAAVADVVAEVTDDKSLPKQQRKELQVEHAPQLSTAAKLVKLADKTCNLRDMVESPPHDWSAERRRDYFAWADRVVAGLRGVNAELERAYDTQRSRGPA